VKSWALRAFLFIVRSDQHKGTLGCRSLKLEHCVSIDVVWLVRISVL